MAIERRDIDFALRAKDMSTATFRDVRKAVADLGRALEAQAAGIRSGDTALSELTNTYKQLELAAKAFSSQQGLIDRFRAQTESLSRYEARAAEARKKADEFAAALANKEKVSLRAQARLDALNRIAERAAKAFADQSEKVSRSREALQRAEIDVRDLDGASKSLLTSSQQLGAAINTAKTLISGYSQEVRRGREEEKQAAAEQRRRAEVLDRFNAAVKERSRVIAAVRAAETAAAREEAEAAKKTEQQTRAYQEQVAAVDRLLASYGRLSAANVQLARTRAREGGGAEAAVLGARGQPQARTLTDITQAVRLQAVAVQETLGKPVQNYLGLLEDLERSLRRVQAIAKQVDGYQAQRAAVQASLTTYQQARANLKALNDEQRRNPSAENAAAVRAALPAYERARAAFIEQLQALRVLREELRQSGIGTRDFGETQRRLVEITAQASRSIRDLTANYDKFGGSARSGPVGFLGLRPYELQNLSFQINDIFTQLASGASLMQTLAQQAGQIAQIQPIWQRIVAFAPAFVTLGAAIGVTVAALSRLNQAAASTRNFAAQAQIRGLTDLSVTPAQLTAIVREIEKIGPSFNEARTAVQAFFNSGVSTSLLRDATEIAVRFARVTGRDIPDATQLLIRGLTEGREGFKALLDANIGFSESTRRTITSLLDQGQVLSAQNVIIAALRDTVRDADERGLSPFRAAAIAVRNAWREVLDELGKTGIVAALSGALTTLAERGRQLASVMRTLRGEVAAIEGGAPPDPRQVIAAQLQRAQERLQTLERRVEEGSSIFRFGSAAEVEEARRNIPLVRAEIERLRVAQENANRAALNGQRIAAERGAEAADQRRLQALQGQLDTLQRVVRERELEGRIADKNLTQAQREAAVRERERLRLLERAPGALETNEGQELLRRQTDVALRELRERIRSETESASQGAAAAIRRDFQAIAQDIQNTLRIRDETVRAIQEDVAAGALSPAEAIARIGQAAEQTRPALQRLRDEAQRFLDQGRGRDVVRDAAIQRVIAQADRGLAGTAGARSGTNAILQQSRQEIQQQFQERQNFIQTQAALEQQGLITRAESERQIVALYGETREALQANIDAYAEANRVAAENGTITQAAARGNAAQIELWRAQLERINPEWARLKQGIENTFTQAGVSFFDSVAKALGELAAGVITLEEAWEAAGRAALQFFADVLKGIAQVILQEQVLQAVRLITKSISAGVAHTGGTVGAPGGARRSVNPGIFAAAPRMHSGGIVGGLRRDERAAILQTGEEVLARDDPRNILNRNKTDGPATPGGDGMPIRNILAIGDEEIANALNSSAGERVMFNLLRRNAPTVRAIVRG